ncbi:putative reverse transcriptase domain-containing protein [Tanacetum coccineum]
MKEKEAPMEDLPLPCGYLTYSHYHLGYIADFDPEGGKEDPEDEEDEEERSTYPGRCKMMYYVLTYAVGYDHATETMTTVNLSDELFEEISGCSPTVAKQSRLIVIYKTKTNMARKSMSQTERQEDKVAENASNKRKWEGQKDHTPGWNAKLRQEEVGQHSNEKSETNNSANKRQKYGRAYIAGNREKKHYGRSKPLCSKCNYHHDGPCAPKCHKCNRVGHLARDCRSSTNANTTNNQRGTGQNQRTLTCYECRNQGHYKSDCPKLKNQNHGNQAGGTGTHGMVLALGGGETDQDPNNIEDEIED